MTTDKTEPAAFDKPILVYATFPTLEVAEAAARALVEARLVACANILPAMVSIYRWQGALERGSEVVGLFKTRLSLRDDVFASIAANHPYDVPAVLALDMAGVAPAYLAWLVAETQGQ